MDGAGDEFLAGAGFAKDTDARFAGGDAVDLREELGHGWTGADEFVFAETMTEFTVFGLETREAEGIFYREEKFVRGEGLLQEIERAETRGLHGHFDIGLTRD